LRDVTGNTPPFVAFDKSGPFVQGPVGQITSRTTTLRDPLTLVVWVADDALVAPGDEAPKTPPVTVLWSKYRGPGRVAFSPERPQVEKIDFKGPPKTTFTGRVTTTATFSEPGEYILHLVANDWSGFGGAGFQCCWTNAQVRVMVEH